MEKEKELKKLYVGNLDYDTTKEDLKELFDPYGTILDCFVVNRKGFGFVTYETEEEAGQALEALNAKPFKDRPLKIDFATTQRK